jgi:large subunit ribosomal protein L25
VLHVSDLKVEEGITIVTDPDTAVATVAVVREEEVEAPVADEAAEVVEPEVIGKGKKEDEA